MFRSILAISWRALLICALAGPARAQSYQVPVGPRAIAMGGAFSAIADDASATFWNPAGLPQIGHQEIGATHADLFGSGIRDNLVTFVLPLSARQAAAADWYSSGLDDGELGYGENRIDLAYGMRVMPWLAVGGTFKYLNTHIASDGTTVTKGQGNGFDFGALARPWQGLRLGLIAQDAFDTRVREGGGEARTAYSRNLRAAAAYTFRNAGTVAFDIDDRWHLGLEATPLDQVALRLGVQDDRKGYERATWSYGAGIKAGVFRFDYAREQYPTLDATDHFSLALEFNFNPSQIRIERVEAADLYTSQFKRYAREPFGTVQLRNLREEPLEAQLSVFVPELMDAPSVQTVLLRPKAVQEVPLTAVFSERALARGEDRTVQVEVKTTYQSRRLVRQDRSAARCVAYAPGAIQWGEGVEQAAAFVTTRDPAVDALARAASGAVVRMGSDPFGNRNLNFAAAITDALASIGVAYVPDPNNPYTAISETAHAVDTVHYPYETLKSRTGDCDDTTVLMAALLENVGVPTRFVDVPGHISLLVGTGLHERNAIALGVDESMYVLADEQVWIPLETTELARGFAKAWQIGAEAYAGWQARGRVATVDVAEAQGRYEPVVPPGRRDEPSVDEGDLRERITKDATTVAEWKREFMSERFGDVKESTPSLVGEIEVAHVYLLAARYDEAGQRLEDALRSDSTSAALLNDLAVVASARGDLPKAEALLRRARTADPADGGVALNLGLVRYVQADTSGAREPIARGLGLAGGFEAAVGLLGLDAAPAGHAGGESGMTAEEARLLLREALQRTAGREPGRQPAGSEGVAGTGPERSSGLRVRNSAARAEAARRLHEFLYWKK